MAVTLYGMPPSHPTHSARLMIERKGIQPRVVNVVPGMHAASVRVLGFRGGTVPAMKLDGQRVQGTRAIARALEEAYPDPALFPADPELLVAVEDAERWGDETFQDVPRFITRWLTVNRPDMRTHMATEVGLPAPAALGKANAPIARYFAHKVGADDTARVRAIVASLPADLDRIDNLIADGVIGTDEPNAADFQIAPTARSLLTFEDLAPLVEGRPIADLAMRLLPEYPSTVPKGMVPQEWLALVEPAATD